MGKDGVKKEKSSKKRKSEASVEDAGDVSMQADASMISAADVSMAVDNNDDAENKSKKAKRVSYNILNTTRLNYD